MPPALLFMSRARTKEEKILALVKWERRRRLQCPHRRKYDQEFTKLPEVGEYVLVWEVDRQWWFTPGFYKCGCDTEHTIKPALFRITKIKNSVFSAESNDLNNLKIKASMADIVFSIGKDHVTDPRQDLSCLNPIQQVLLVTTMMENKDGKRNAW